MHRLQILSKSVSLWISLGMSHHAAAFSYYAPFALVPLILISLGISSTFFGFEFVRNMFISWGAMFGPDLTSLISYAVQNLDVQVHSYDVPILAIAFFSVTGVAAINVLGYGFRHIWNIQENDLKSWLWQTFRSIFFIAILQIYVLAIISIEGVWAMLELENRLVPVLIWFFSISFFFFLLYRFLVAKAPSISGCLVGALTAGLLFVFAKNLVTLYLATKPALNIFGAAGLILVLLVWVYVIASVIYYGAIVASEFEKRKAMANI